MLSSKEAYTRFSSEALDIDSISDITGISMSKMDYIERSSQHSGSFGSDNTDALLNASLRDFEGDESLLESVSMVGEDMGPYRSPGKERISSRKQQVTFAESVKTDIVPEEFSVHVGSSEVIQVQNGAFSASQDNSGIHFYGMQDSSSIPYSHSFEESKNFKDFDPGLNQKAKSMGNLKNEAKYMPRKFSSDSEVTISSRDSVIKHHSSLPSVNAESVPKTNRFGQNITNGELRQSQADVFKSNLFTQEGPGGSENWVKFQERISETDEKHWTDTRTDIGPHSPGHSGLMNDTHNVRDVNSQHGLIIEDPSIYDGQNMSRHSQSKENNKDFHDADCTIRNVIGESKTKYDGPSISSSQKLRDEFILATNRNAHSRDGSFVQDGRSQLERTRSMDRLQDSFVQHSHGEEMLLGVRHDPETNELYDDKVREGADLLSRVLGAEHNASFTSYSSRSSERNEKLKSNSFREKGSLSKQRSLDSSHSSEAKLPRSSSPKKDHALNTRTVSNEDDNTLNRQFEGKTFDEPPNDRAAGQKQLELDIEEILSRKKMAMYELQTLEESVQRNKADMKSSENLVEQYRSQAMQARSELMDLERKRYQLREECATLDGVIKKTKQKKTFNSDDVIFGRSKDEIFTALQEREQFKQDLDSARESLKREQKNSKMAQDDFREKIKSLESEFRKQQEENVKNLQMMKEERKSHIEILEEKMRRETNHWKRATENAELRMKQLEESLFERNEELDKVRKQLREEKQKNLDIEKHWRSQLESERQDADIKYDGQERSWKDQEEKLLQKQKELENLVEERTTDFRRSEERCRSQTEELHKIIENKNEEIKMVRGLVRQQEDATRVLGERLRNEAKEHVRNAVENERQSLHKEKERIKRTIDEEKEKQGRIMKQVTEQLEIEKESHLQTKESLNKLKQFTVQADNLEKIDQETAKAIYEECRKIAEIVDLPPPYRTPTRFSDEQSSRNDDEARQSPTNQALASLRQCNNELRQRLSDMKKEMAKQSNKSKPSSTSDHELAELRKRLAEKDEEILRLQRKHREEIQKFKEEKKKEQLSYRRTIAKLEQEFQKLVATKISSTPYKTKRDQISPSTISTSNGTTYPQAPAVNPAARVVEKSSSADLLKHLQDRVKKLRAENENLKKSSDRENLVKNARHNSESALFQSKGLTMSQLRTPTHGAGQINENIEQVSRVQKLLASSKKNDIAVGQSNTD